MYKALAERWTNGTPIEVNTHKGGGGNVVTFAAALSSTDLVSDALAFAEVVVEGMVRGAIEEEPDLLCLGVVDLPDEALVRTAQDAVEAKYGLTLRIIEPGQTTFTLDGGRLVPDSAEGFIH